MSKNSSTLIYFCINYELPFFSVEIDHCSPNPCLHDGHCSEINGGLGFVCQCQLGYKGQNCESKFLFIDLIF